MELTAALRGGKGALHHRHETFIRPIGSQTPHGLGGSSFRIPPPGTCEIDRIKLRVCNISLAGNGLRTHLIYKVRGFMGEC